METNIQLINSNATLEEASKKMKEYSCGFLPAGVNHIPEGIITDRDIVIRALAEGKDPKNEKVCDYMTSDIYSCQETDTLEDAAIVMGANNISRLVVKDATDTICGILTFGRIIRKHDNKQEISDVVEKATGKMI
ncbi:CBS domain-containing protein [Nitrosomonas oligotropha]|nr:CBS domain-containing protein [Nitrosomonas oligotropha]